MGWKPKFTIKQSVKITTDYLLNNCRGYIINNMKIITLGLYHLGLTFSACLAEIGNEIILTDENDQIVKDAELGKFQIFEPGLTKIFDKYKQKNLIKFKKIDEFKETKNNILVDFNRYSN